LEAVEDEEAQDQKAAEGKPVQEYLMIQAAQASLRLIAFSFGTAFC